MEATKPTQRTIELTRVINAETMLNRLIRFVHNGLAFVGLCFMTSGMPAAWEAMMPKLAEAATGAPSAPVVVATEVSKPEEEARANLKGSELGALAWCATYYDEKKTLKHTDNVSDVTIDGIEGIEWCATYYKKFKTKIEKQLEGK